MPRAQTVDYQAPVDHYDNFPCLPGLRIPVRDCRGPALGIPGMLDSGTQEQTDRWKGYTFSDSERLVSSRYGTSSLDDHIHD